MKNLNYLNKYFIKYRFKIWIGFLFVVMANIFALFPAHLIGKSFNLIIKEIQTIQNNNELNLDSLYYLLLVYSSLLILFSILRGVFMFYMRQNIIVASRYIEYDLKNEIYQKYQSLSYSFYKQNNSGDLLNRITEDVTRVRMYLGPAVMYTLNLVTLIVLIVSRMITVSPLLTSIILIPLPILSFLIYKVSNRINLKSNVVQEYLSLLTNSVQETFSGIRLIKSFFREKEITERFDKLSETYMNEHISLSKINSIFFPLVLLLVGLSVLLTVYVGGVLVVDQKITIGEVAEFIIYVNMLTWPVTSVGWVTEVIQRASASQARINSFLNTQDFTIFHKTKHHLNKQSSIQKQILCSSISYQYPNSKSLALDKIDVEIDSNSIVGFVGHVGSGKSTILQIMAGILTQKSGILSFDNVSCESLNWFHFRESISYVSQDTFLFSDSIRNNILFGNETITDSDLFNITKNLHILDEINSFNDGFETHIGEGGLTLSGGQKQRIALARALIKNPRFLLLDDAFSSIDSSIELKIMNYIYDTFKETTIVLTSNRLSVLNYCNKIFVLKNGKIVQQGIPNELIKQDGEYQNLFFNQLRSI